MTSLQIIGDTADVYLQNTDIVCSGNATLETDTGDIDIKLAGSALDYTIRVEVDTGKTNVHTQIGGERKLSIEVDTGDIYVRFEK